ncbi:hypothetical protein GCM10010094_03490 [Streptomyces flaveus]|uniref:Radical SAM core domain-containing protein n=1 Tax=Streptomyces flaveus TaxID=66370 RepID=A0A917QF28_9ACTN|nr:hypothetical protein GCM10010094_03490 [Streptomyces flaveus]
MGASPATATADRLAVLAERGTTRLSLGVQSFVDAEARSAVRPQRRADVEAALARIRDAGIPVLNIDLIYGIEGQTEESWRRSLDAALAWQPEELYLYRSCSLSHRQSCVQDCLSVACRERSEDYACQTDGMVGLGCGARSYTSALHYSFDYAVDMHRIRGIIDDYTGRATDDFRHADFGWRMSAEEARRRHLLQSLLQAEGMPVADYRTRFGTSPGDDFATELARFHYRGWLDDSAAPDLLRLSPEGLAHSDALGPALFSAAVRERMAVYEAK